MTYKYQPEKGFIPGIPARDLKDDEFNALTEQQQKTAIDSSVYLAPVKAAEQKPEEKKETTHDTK